MVSIKNRIDDLIIFLLSILPLALAAGPAIIESTVLVTILLFFISKRKIKVEKFDTIIFIFYFYLIFTSGLSDFKIHSLSSSLLIIRFILLYYIFKYYFHTEFKFKLINVTLIILSITFIILIFDGFFQYFFNISLFGTQLVDEYRFTMHFRSKEYIMGSYISKMIPIFLGLWYLKYKNFDFKINLSLFILLIFIFSCMVLSNDRSATFLMVAFVFSLLILSKLKNSYKISLFLGLLILMTLAVNFVPSLKERYIKQTYIEIIGKNDDLIAEKKEILKGDDKKTNFLNFNINNKDIFIFSTAHEAHIKSALNMFFNNPLIGVGPNNFRNLCLNKDYGIYEERGCSTHPHHILSQVLAETGIFGLFFYLIIFIYLGFKLLKQLFKKNLEFNITCLYLFYFLIIMPLLPSGNIFNNWYLYSLTLPFLYLNFTK